MDVTENFEPLIQRVAVAIHTARCRMEGCNLDYGVEDRFAAEVAVATMRSSLNALRNPPFAYYADWQHDGNAYATGILNEWKQQVEQLLGRAGLPTNRGDGFRPSERDGPMIENTTQRHAAAHLLGMMSDGQSDYITNMEADGQRQLLNSDVLPSDILHGEQADYEALGFTFGDEVEGDPTFRHATLPEGWRREGSDHDMWSYIVDAEGTRRVAIFYKAAFYDRKAHMSIAQAQL